MGRCPLAALPARVLNLHGTELVHLKGTVVQPYPLLAEKHGPR